MYWFDVDVARTCGILCAGAVECMEREEMSQEVEMISFVSNERRS